MTWDLRELSRVLDDGGLTPIFVIIKKLENWH